MSSFRTMSDAAGKLAADLAAGTLTPQEAARQLAELLRESLRLIERIENDIQHLRSICRK